ncbi:MAG: hypothetical protein JSU69_06235 [Candidatus Zixiibacteriota bacterium]|nr:MAG: hypothetical protein JSU69_06235 [candidate division Zixibacteria bacterium]
MKRIEFLIALALASCLILSIQCGDKGTEPKPPSGLVGTWQWVVSCGGFAYQCYYADSVDYTRLITFRADSTYIETIDNATVFSGRFSVVRKEIWGSDTANVLVIEGYNFELIIDSLTITTLVLTDHCYDCFVGTYYRLFPI